jgi:cell division septal protein FtsQ
VRLARRVDERRWTLELVDGGAVHLPATGEAAALATVSTLIRSGLPKGTEIDMRVPQRPRVREPLGAQAARAPVSANNF